MNFFYSKTLQIILNILTAIGTIGAVLLSLYFSRKESKERLQLNLRKQASKVYLTMSSYNGNKLLVVLHNQSNLPIHDIFIVTVLNKSGPSINDQLNTFGHVKYIETVEPGKTEVMMKNRGNAMGGKHESAIIFFTDANGTEWVIDNKSRLQQSKNYEEKIIKFKLAFFPPY